MKEVYNDVKSKMSKTLDVLNSEFSSIRAGRANPAILDRVTVEYYGTQTPISQIGNISVPEPRTLLIQPWDASVLILVEKAISKSDIGINPQNDGKVIRLNFPPLTEERRKDLVKEIHKLAEVAKVAVRNIRRDAIDKYKDMKKKSEITEDDLKEMEKDIQVLTDNFIKDIEITAQNKEKEIITI